MKHVVATKKLEWDMVIVPVSTGYKAHGGSLDKSSYFPLYL